MATKTALTRLRGAGAALGLALRQVKMQSQEMQQEGIGQPFA